MKNLAYYLEKAKGEGWAVPQFNFCTASQLKGIVLSAQKLKSPIILGTSEGEAKFFGLKTAVFYRDMMAKEHKIPIFLNLDHGKSLDYIKQAVLAGYDMVHFDGSKLSLEENIKETKKVVAFAKRKKVLVEGEVGKMPTDSSKLYDEDFKINEQDLTTPEQAQEYIEKTKVDLLAVSFGTFHGIDMSGKNPELNINRLMEITEVVPDIFLVMHGGSATPEVDVKKAIKSGIVKININTELRLAYSGAIRRYLIENPEEITPYKFLPEAEKKVQAVAEQKIKLFGGQNKV